jgi:hypothetical protein
MPVLRSICDLRIAVGYLGERAQGGWWDTAFLNSIGFRYLQIVYPKTAASAAVTAASDAACKAHDELIGRGRVAHLFRLNEQTEVKVRSHLASLKIEDMAGLCSPDSALGLLLETAAGAKPPEAFGPLHIGTLKHLDKPESLSQLAAVYAAAFRTGTRVFPYFA